MRFYDCSTAPSPRRVRIFVAEKGIEVETVEVDLRNGEHLSESFRAINPYCTVPVLELDDGTRLTSTAGIWRYLEEVHPSPPLLGVDAAERALVADREWRVETDGFMAVAEALRNGSKRLQGRALTGPHEYAQIPALAERGRLRTGRFLAHLDEILRDHPYVAGERYSAADITALVTVDFARWLKIELPEDAVHARRWHEAVSARESARA